MVCGFKRCLKLHRDIGTSKLTPNRISLDNLAAFPEEAARLRRKAKAVTASLVSAVNSSGFAKKKKKILLENGSLRYEERVSNIWNSFSSLQYLSG